MVLSLNPQSTYTFILIFLTIQTVKYYFNITILQIYASDYIKNIAIYIF